ncbi:hypothetical protein CYMTET_44234 [Cymbomonas tetramitiformis]|uniref:Uncharacterized protein n=1 Tax=Cymbomonas tetramitiformis TaxID=36881 RepID=A0AAE0C2P9_9CHLO|nr:hypothetical protein CYMTET_44234 [Cymbomonas tetramitiformis]
MNILVNGDGVIEDTTSVMRQVPGWTPLSPDATLPGHHITSRLHNKLRGFVDHSSSATENFLSELELCLPEFKSLRESRCQASPLLPRVLEVWGPPLSRRKRLSALVSLAGTPDRLSPLCEPSDDVLISVHGSPTPIPLPPFCPSLFQISPASFEPEGERIVYHQTAAAMMTLVASLKSYREEDFHQNMKVIQLHPEENGPEQCDFVPSSPARLQSCLR